MTRPTNVGDALPGNLRGQDGQQQKRRHYGSTQPTAQTSIMHIQACLGPVRTSLPISRQLNSRGQTENNWAVLLLKTRTHGPLIAIHQPDLTELEPWHDHPKESSDSEKAPQFENLAEQSLHGCRDRSSWTGCPPLRPVGFDWRYLHWSD